MAQMQNLFYDDAPYHILYYDDTLVAYRTDKFGGLEEPARERRPAVRLRTLGYSVLQDATAATPVPPTPGASEAVVTPTGPAATAAPSTAPEAPTAGSSSPPVLPLALIGLVVVVAIVALVLRRRPRTAPDDDE